MAVPPNFATAQTADIFKVIETTHAAYIGKVHKGPGLFSKIGETTTVPSYVAKVANKYTVTVNDFAEGINHMCQMSVRAFSKLCKFGGTPTYAFAF